MQQLPVITDLPGGTGVKMAAMAGSLSSEDLTALIVTLHAGNGWIANVIRDGREHFFVLSYPSSAQRVALLGACVAGNEQLAFRQTATVLKKLEALSEKYRCDQFMVFCPGGFAANANRLAEYNLLMYDQEKISRLARTFNVDRSKAPSIQLFAHNRNTYKKVQALFGSNNRVAVVQATGTGKSYLIARLLLDNHEGNKIVLAPGNYILEQMREHVLWARNVTFMTYTKTMLISEKEREELNPALIVLDEYHRCGAEEWGKGVQAILAAFPGAKVFGTSATPVRFMDESRDMSKELFDGVVAENLSLAQAIVRRILPMPKYVTALYTLSEELDAMRGEIRRSMAREAKKKTLLAELDTFSLDWEKSSGIPRVLQKHIRPFMRKFIVFCRESDHLIEMEKLVRGWFRQALPDISISTYRVMSAEPSSDENLIRFKKAEDNERLHLLFSINMLNEGLHVDDVHGVLLLRPTESPTIFYQQIGRCLKVGGSDKPVIFDFVNNFNSIRAKDFMYDLETERRSFGLTRERDGLVDRCPDFTIFDEVREITELFGQIRFQVDTTAIRLKELEAYKKEFGDCNVPLKYHANPSLGAWVINRRQQFHKGKLDKDVVDKLNAMGFSWDPESENWEKNFRKLQDFKKQKGHCNVPNTWHDKKFAVWVHVQRVMYKDSKVVPERVRRLEKLGFQWTLKKRMDEALWEKSFAALAAFKEKHGHLTVPVKTMRSLHNWIADQRKKYAIGIILKPQQIQRLESLGFKWNPRSEDEAAWEKQFARLLKFKEEHGHLRVSQSRHVKLYTWVANQRTNFTKGIRISNEQVRRLCEIGFQFQPTQANWEMKYQAAAESWKKYGRVCLDKHKGPDIAVSHWLANQRAAWRKGKLQPYQIELLEALGLDKGVSKK